MIRPTAMRKKKVPKRPTRRRARATGSHRLNVKQSMRYSVSFALLTIALLTGCHRQSFEVSLPALRYHDDGRSEPMHPPGVMVQGIEARTAHRPVHPGASVCIPSEPRLEAEDRLLQAVIPPNLYASLAARVSDDLRRMGFAPSAGKCEFMVDLDFGTFQGEGEFLEDAFFHVFGITASEVRPRDRFRASWAGVASLTDVTELNPGDSDEQAIALLEKLADGAVRHFGEIGRWFEPFEPGEEDSEP